MFINKTENFLSSGLCRSSRPLDENKRKRKERQILGLCKRHKEAVQHKVDSDTNCSWCTWNDPQRL